MRDKRATVDGVGSIVEAYLGDVLRLRREIVHPRDKPTGKAIFVGLEHIESGTGRRVGQIEIEKSMLTGRKPVFRKGDIVYGYLRPYLNKVWIAEFVGLCSVDQYVYSVDTEIADTEYLAWFLRSPAFLGRAPISETPGQLPRIRLEEIASVRISLPSLSDQRRAAAVLNEQMTAIERARVAAAARLQATRALSAAITNGAFATLPPDLPRRELGTVSKLVRGVSFDKAESRPNETAGTAPILRAGNIQDELDLHGDLVWVPERFISNEQLLQKEDIALCLSSGSSRLVGKTAQLRLPWRGSVGAFCGIIRALPPMLPVFLASWFRSHDFATWLTTRVRGANIQNLRLSELAVALVPAPPVAIQRAFLDSLNAKLKVAQTSQVCATRQLTQIELLGTAFLRRAFAGEL